ncbi:MAG: peptide deformylase [Lachnospiraceae bacterium]|nr:peptide deformylase [Lachnospiraceae bacterium]MBR3637687.1 peptide deformylase [Lachnospiraceae bacterium]
MAIRNIRTLGEDVLRAKAKEVTEVTPRIRELIDDMFETMYEANGVGLAAPQVGIRKRIVVVDVTGEDPVALINPVILKSDGEQTGYEGCLSVPGKTGIVTRANHVIVEAYNENMEKFTIEAEELMARALQHEIDHLDGVVYVDLVKEGELYNNEDLEKMQDEEE